MQKRTPAALTLSAVSLISALTLLACPQAGAALVLAVDLGAASPFAVLAGAGISVAAPAGTVITGDIGSYPTSSLTGLEYVTLDGVNRSGEGVMPFAKTDLESAYADAAGRTADYTYGDGTILSGVLEGGVHYSAGSLTINGTITLDAGGDSSMVWIFQTVSSLGTGSGSQVILTNGALAENVFWQVGTSATLGSGSDFAGSILADQSVTLNTGTTLVGRAMAIDGAVSMGSANITIPEPSAVVLCATGLVLMVSRRRIHRTDKPTA